ncbi:TPA: type VI secretion system tip protein VgrG [Salmonella enterica]|nr:type VI secretion system tip protein VgrG [Salmonella enterica]
MMYRCLPDHHQDEAVLRSVLKTLRQQCKQIKSLTGFTLPVVLSAEFSGPETPWIIVRGDKPIVCPVNDSPQAFIDWQQAEDNILALPVVSEAFSFIRNTLADELEKPDRLTPPERAFSVAMRLGTRDYNYRDALTPQDSAESIFSKEGITTGETYHYAEPFLTAGDADSPETGAYFARLRHERILNAQYRVSGHSSSPHLAPGQVLETDGTLPDAVKDGIVITTVRTSGSRKSSFTLTFEGNRYAVPYREAGDDSSPEPETESGAFYARIHHERELNKSSRIHLFSNAAHLAPGQVLEPQGNVIAALKEGVILTLVTFRGARDSRLQVSVWGMPYSERYCFRPAEIPRPEIHGTLPARIESREKNDIYAYLDEHGRYRVKLDFDREGTEPGYGYLWLRMAKPYAGDTLGWHTPLTDGTEVAVAYSNGDIDLPYIAYALHDSEHPDHVNRDNHTRNVLRTPANNKLRMEDRRGEEHVRLATEYGKTQLNSGHLVDAQGQRRGTGAELRTDEWGTIRAGKGLFVSADAQAKAQGEVLDMSAALEEIDRLNQQLQQLEIAAEQAQALKADVDSQIRMFEQRLKPLSEALLMSAPEGMALTSGEHMQIAATKNVAMNAGGDVSAGVMGNLTALTGEKLGVFARTGQLSLKVSEGPVDMQAQNAAMLLFAEKKLTMSSASDISFAGKKRITLIGGGSYLRLEAGKVEYGTTATYLRRVKRTMAAGAASIPVKAVTGGGLCLSCLMKAAINGNAFVIRGEP